MDLTVEKTESGYVVMKRQQKDNKPSLYTGVGYEWEWVPAGLDELNEICKRLAVDTHADSISITNNATVGLYGQGCGGING